jgi:sigma-B regulation protein RsbU (phosphoserine phosphatase)
MQMTTQPAMYGQREDIWEMAAGVAPVPSIANGDRNCTQAEELSALRREHDELRRTVFEAAHMQRRLCGPRQLRRGPYTLAGELFPVQHVSGDFLSVFEQESRLIFALGDIAGKGLMAGMWFTQMAGLIRMSINGRGLAAAMSAINHELCCTESGPPLTSLFLASLDVESDEITYCNAGHPPSLIVRRTGTVEQLEIGGPILGAVPEAAYGTARIRLKVGDSLLSYSDGIMECRNPLREEFGTERLILAAQSAAYSSATGKLFSLLGAVEDFVGTGQREDDFAVLWLCRDDRD